MCRHCSHPFSICIIVDEGVVGGGGGGGGGGGDRSACGAKYVRVTSTDSVMSVYM